MKYRDDACDESVFSTFPHVRRDQENVGEVGGRHEARDELLVLLLHQTGLMTEAFSLTPHMIGGLDGDAEIQQGVGGGIPLLTFLGMILRAPYVLLKSIICRFFLTCRDSRW